MTFLESNQIYSNLDPTEKIKLHLINGLEIPFNDSWKKIGINLSGGADSCCLLLLLCDIIKQTNIDCEVHVISHIRCYNTRPWQGPIAKDLFDMFVTEYPSIKFIRHTNFIPPELEWGVLGPITKDEDGRPRSGDQICVGSFNNYIIAKEKLDAVFNATSANPVGQTWDGGMENRNKPASAGLLKDLYLKKDKFVICHPFRFVDKRWIIAQYHLHKKINFYKMTRSCEGDINHPNLKNVGDLHIDLPTCGDCWWCKERTWAEEHYKDFMELSIDV